jgi:hypothetical protein
MLVTETSEDLCPNPTCHCFGSFSREYCSTACERQFGNSDAPDFCHCAHCECAEDDLEHVDYDRD